MIWTILALSLWVVLGGFISYYGDLQGRRWGKRRVSWFGLRPKHTAILITSLTGGFIALFSVASLMIIVPTVRDVVTHGENAIEDNKRLIAVEKQQQISDKLDRERVNRESLLTQQANDKKIAEGIRKLADVQMQLSKVQASLAPLNARLNELKTKVTVLQDQRLKLEAQNTRAGYINEGLIAKNLEMGRQNTKLVAANSSLKQENADLSHIGERYRESDEVWYKSNMAKQTLNDSLQTHNDALEKEKTQLEMQIAEYHHQQEEVLNLIHQRDQLDSQLQELSNKIAKQNRSLLLGNVILRAGVELGRISIDSHLRPQAIKKQIATLMTSASDQAKKFGAENGEDGQAVSLPQQQRPTLSGYESRDENAQIDSLAEEWSGSDISYVVVATTVTNCLAGDPAYIDLHRYPVVRVFAKGAEVASRIIDGHSKVDDIISNLMAFLQKDVQKSALEAGIIPRVDPETGQSEVGVLGTADLFRLTDTVRRMRGPILLTARAKQDVSSADRLDLTFKVSRLPSPPQTVATE